MANRAEVVRIGSRFRAYRIASPAHEVVIVIARHLSEAIDVLVRWRRAEDISEANLIVEPGWGQKLSDAGRAHLEQALSRCKEPSIACRYRAASGWELAKPERM